LLKLFFIGLFMSSPVFAFKDGTPYVGVAYYSQNILGKTTTSENSSPNFLGAASYPLNFKYDWGFSYDWFLSPQLTHTPVPRGSADNSAKVTTMLLAFPIGKNFGFSSDKVWDWFVGPGFLRYTIQGAGGTESMSNGTGTAVFARPGRSSTVQNVVMVAGSSFNLRRSRFGLDLIVEGLAGAKRSESMMIRFDFNLSGGY
jgi:hypothetical protein